MARYAQIRTYILMYVKSYYRGENGLVLFFAAFEKNHADTKSIAHKALGLVKRTRTDALLIEKQFKEVINVLYPLGHY